VPIHLRLVIGSQVKDALATAGGDHVVIAVHRLGYDKSGEGTVVQTALRPGRDKRPMPQPFSRWAPEGIWHPTPRRRHPLRRRRCRPLRRRTVTMPHDLFPVSLPWVCLWLMPTANLIGYGRLVWGTPKSGRDCRLHRHLHVGQRLRTVAHRVVVLSQHRTGLRCGEEAPCSFHVNGN
jgi:hypothetical protein